MKTKMVILEKPYCTPVDYRFESENFCRRSEIANLTEKKRVVFERKLEVYGYYHGIQVEIICNEEGLGVLPLIPRTPPKFIHHSNCRCTLK